MIFAVFERNYGNDELVGCFTDHDKAMEVLRSLPDGYYHVFRSEDGKPVSTYNLTEVWQDEP